MGFAVPKNDTTLGHTNFQIIVTHNVCMRYSRVICQTKLHWDSSSIHMMAYTSIEHLPAYCVHRWSGCNIC